MIQDHRGNNHHVDDDCPKVSPPANHQKKMKIHVIDNTAAAGMTCAILILDALSGLYLLGTGIPSGWEAWLNALLSVMMLFSGILIIAGKRLGWKIGAVSALIALVWYLEGIFEYPILLKVSIYGIGILKALVVLALAYVRLRQRADPTATAQRGQHFHF